MWSKYGTQYMQQCIVFLVVLLHAMHCVSLLVKQEKAGRALTCGTATSTCPCLQTCVCVRTAYFRPGWSWINSHTQGQGRILALLDRSPKQGSRCAVCPAGPRGQQEQGKGQPDPLPSQTELPTCFHWVTKGCFLFLHFKKIILSYIKHREPLLLVCGYLLEPISFLSFSFWLVHFFKFIYWASKLVNNVEKWSRYVFSVQLANL